jgi:hypothetical protein
MVCGEEVMREGFTKLAIGLTAVASLALGGVFLIIPGWFVALSEAESVNIAWLRNVGAGLVAVQGFGLLVAIFRRRDTNPILLLAAMASTIQSIAGWYSIFTGEFSAQARWAVIVPFVLATLASIFLWVSWRSRRRAAAGLPTGPRASQAVADAPAAEPLPADAPVYDDEMQ